MSANGRRKGDSVLLVSFCNVKDAEKPAIAIVNLESDGPEFRWVEFDNGVSLRGATGLCYWNDLVCVAVQGGARLQGKSRVPLSFILLEPASGFKQVGEGVLPLDPPPDTHSVCFRDGQLYFALSGRDSIYKAWFEDRSRKWETSLYWTFPGSSGIADENHVNGIECIEGSLCVSGLGKKEAGLWASTKKGFVYDIERSKYIIDGLHHPHSLLEAYGTLWTCESTKRKLVSRDGWEYELPAGYVRGLAASEETFYVGASKRRIGSKSSGDLKNYEGVCCIYKISRASGELQMLIDFSEFRNEIYEMMLV